MQEEYNGHCLTIIALPGSKKKDPTPVNQLAPSPVPKVSPYPTAQYVSVPNTTSTTFFIIMFTSFFLLDIPLSNRPNPIKIQNEAGILS